MELLPVDSVTVVNRKVRGISRVTDAQCDNLLKGDRLNLQQQDQLFALLLEYHDLFVKDLMILGGQAKSSIELSWESLH